MTKISYLSAVIEKYPHLKDDDFPVKLTARGLKRLIEQAYDKGESAGFNKGYKLGAESIKRPIPDLFSTMFSK